MRVLLDDVFATATYTVPMLSGWVTPPSGIDVELIADLTADGIDAADVALAPLSELPRLQQSHAVIADVAVVADAVGAIAMRTPVRPDEIEATPVRLLDTGGNAEVLGHAVLKPFYGIEATAWLHDDDVDAARAEVVIVAGAEALREPEAGFSEDLTRAWFILTAQPVVSHVLLAPTLLAPDIVDSVVDFCVAAKTEGLARRREWRPALTDREGISRDRANAFWAAQRFSLTEADQRAMLDLLQRCLREASDSSVINVQFVRGAGSA